MQLVRGQRFEFYNGSTEETREYELEDFEGETVKGRLCRLRNVETDGIAHITVHTLLSEKPGPTGSVWRFVAEAAVPEFEEAA